MDIIRSIVDFKRRLRLLSEGEISDLVRDEDFKYILRVEEILVIGQDIRWGSQVKTFLKAELPQLMIKIKKNALSRIDTMEISKSERLKLKDSLTREIDYYQTELIEKQRIETESSGQTDNKIIFDLTVGQLASFIRILIDSSILDKKQYNKGEKTEFAKSICNNINITEKHKNGEVISVKSMNNNLSTLQPIDLEFWQGKFNSLNVSATNLLINIINKEDKLNKKSRK